MAKIKLSNYKAVILAGGAGTRLYPVTKEIPKPLLPIKRKPIINYLVEMFQKQGIKDIAVLINKDFQEDFKWWQKRYFPQNNIKLVQESKPLGTFGGLCFLKNWLLNSPFFLTNGDELEEVDLKEMAELHQKTGCLGTIALVEVPNPQDYGVVLCQSDRVKEFLEKPSPAQISKKFGAGKNPPSQYINSGLYLLSPKILDYLSGPQFLMIEKDIFPKLAKEQKLAGFKFKGRWRDCGTWERYSDALKNWE